MEASAGASMEASAKTLLARMGRNMDGKSRALLRIHLRRALVHVRQCQQNGKPVLDCCGEAGDLFFLLQSVLAAARQDHNEMVRLLEHMVGQMVPDTTPLALSHRELGLMAETQQ